MAIEYGPILATDADENIAVSSSAVNLTLPAEFSSKGVNSGKAVIQVRDAAILYTINGTAPTAADESTGNKLNVGDELVITSLSEMRNLNMIRATGTDGAVFVRYEKRIN